MQIQNKVKVQMQIQNKVKVQMQNKIKVQVQNKVKVLIPNSQYMSTQNIKRSGLNVSQIIQFVRFITQVCSSFDSGSRMNPPRWERFIRRGMRYMNIHLYAAQVYCNSWPHISDFIKVENSQVWRKFPGYGCEYQIIEREAPWGLDCSDQNYLKTLWSI